VNNGPELKRILEALFFASDSPLSCRELNEILEGFSMEEITGAVDSLILEYQSDDKPLQLIEVAGGFQFTSKPRYYRWIRELYRSRKESRLSGAALETLAVIAYRQPVPRSEIERIRGVNVDGVLQNLLGRNLVNVTGREKKIGRALLYGTTREFLINFGLKNLKELPSYEEVERLFRPDEDSFEEEVKEEKEVDYSKHGEVLFRPER
jgi:segregation and condensation protein B